MKFFVLFLICTLSAAACRDTPVSQLLPWIKSKVNYETKNEASSAELEISDRTVRSASGDPALDEIAQEARETVSDFIRHMRNPRKGEEQFRIKYPFPADTGSGIDKEYLWLSDITFRNNRYFARVANRPYYTSDLEPGIEVIFSMDEIADWMYLKNGKIIGGRSIKYLIEKIPPIDRDEEMERILGFF